MDEIESYKIFISHSNRDTWVARQIELQIQKLGSFITFLDAKKIQIGDDFEIVLSDELRSSQEMLILLTPWALNRRYIWMEMGAAWGLGLKMILVLYGLKRTDLQQDDNIPIIIKRTTVVDINDLDTYFTQLSKRVY